MTSQQLPSGQRMQLARLSGLLSRITAGIDRDLTPDEKLGLIWETTTDPVVLGHAAGPYIGGDRAGDHGAAEALDLLRAAGADEDTAQASAEWHRERIARRAAGPA